MVRPSRCHKVNVKKGPWTEAEDAKMLACVSKHGTGNWTCIPKKAGLKRCGKSCRLRWTNYLRPDLKQDHGFTAEEEDLIIKLHAAIGSRWTIIAQQLPGRSDNDVKNYWNTKLRKKLKYMGIDPVTHKPYSQILADYENIEELSSIGQRRIGSIHKDLKGVFMVKTESYSLNNPFSATANTAASSSTIAAAEPTIPNSLINSRIYGGNYYSLDLLTQLQSITLVTEASSSNINNPGTMSSPASFFTQHDSSPASPSIAGQGQGQEPFCWRDFLMEEAFQLPGDQAEGTKQLGIQLPHTIMGSEEEAAGTDQLIMMTQDNSAVSAAVAAASSDTSFVEALLDQESDMFFNFPGLVMEEPLYC
ncbi:hypothetical protein Dimus_023877 [Dionaea muscipula]